mgnify:CR=1 FL=1
MHFVSRPGPSIVVDPLSSDAQCLLFPSTGSCSVQVQLYTSRHKWLGEWGTSMGRG